MYFSIFCIFSCKRFSDVTKKYACGLNVLVGKLNFHKGINENYDKRFCTYTISRLKAVSIRFQNVTHE